MRFTNPKRRQPPAVIIISLIDVMIVMLIFLMVTTTFKEHPAVKLKLPESQEAAEGSTANSVIITIPKAAGTFFVGNTPVTMNTLRTKLVEAKAKNPGIQVGIRADRESTTQQLLDVMGAAKAAGISPSLQIYTEVGKSP